MDSFLKSVDSYLKLIPDHKPQGISEQIQPKCIVLYFPLHCPLALKHEETASESEVTPTFEDSVAEAQQTHFEATVVENFPHVQPGNDQRGTGAPSSITDELCSSLQMPQKPLRMDIVYNNTTVCSAKCRTPLHIVWPHRW